MEELLIITTIVASSVAHAAFAPNLYHPKVSIVNKIVDVNASCDLKHFNITILMEQPFKGLLFAKDFSHECHATETNNSFSLHLPTSGCGIRLSSKTNDEHESVYYMATLVVQQDRYLQQATDLEYTVKCLLQENLMSVKSKPMLDAVKKLMGQKKTTRTGRMKNLAEKSKESTTSFENENDLIEALSATKAWMEIIPEEDNDHPGILQVGEPALLIIKSTLPVGIGWKIIDCVAHDGLGDSSQKLLDQHGCPLDELLLPEPLMGPPKSIALMRHQELISKFAAFKFPDRDRLHLSCGLQLCRGSCETVDCKSSLANESEMRLARELSQDGDGEILDRFEVFNSVEVIAPSIELEEFRNDNNRNNVDDVFKSLGRLPGDKTFCVSSDKMAITFALLGLIFLFAVIVAIGALMRARRSGSSFSHYSKSLFSSSSGGSRFGSSKMLLHENPLMLQPYRGVPYGRVF
uniref:ZP domain-containing protein n=1 Tax=Photinus pyralis TaxID=7054 RepID=A0A1Y1N8Q4_PHOPY